MKDLFQQLRAIVSLGLRWQVCVLAAYGASEIARDWLGGAFIGVAIVAFVAAVIIVFLPVRYPWNWQGITQQGMSTK